MDNIAFLQFGSASRGESCMTVSVPVQHTGKRSSRMAHDATALRVKYLGHWYRVYTSHANDAFIWYMGGPVDVTIAPIFTDFHKTGRTYRKISLSGYSERERYWHYLGTTEQWKTCRDAQLAHAIRHNRMGAWETRARFEG